MFPFAFRQHQGPLRAVAAKGRFRRTSRGPPGCAKSQSIAVASSAIWKTVRSELSSGKKINHLTILMGTYCLRSKVDSSETSPTET